MVNAVTPRWIRFPGGVRTGRITLNPVSTFRGELRTHPHGATHSVTETVGSPSSNVEVTMPGSTYSLPGVP